MEESGGTEVLLTEESAFLLRTSRTSAPNIRDDMVDSETAGCSMDFGGHKSPLSLRRPGLGTHGFGSIHCALWTDMQP